MFPRPLEQPAYKWTTQKLLITKKSKVMYWSHGSLCDQMHGLNLQASAFLADNTTLELLYKYLGSINRSRICQQLQLL
jgi:hypothetical protein